MRSFLLWPMLVLMAFAFAQSPALAQQADQATLVSGRVTSLQGAPIAGAQVVFGKGGVFARTVTGQNGTFATTLAPGQYHLSASALGFRPIAHDIAVETTPLSLNLQLSVASESLIEIGRVGINSNPGLSTSSNVTVEVNPQNYAQNGVERVSDALTDQVGITVARPFGGAATLPATIALHGPDPSETLIDIDGHELNNSNTGDFDLSLLDTADFSSIELIYGIAPSSLIGPDTIGGAINLRTLEPTSQPHGLIRFGGGSYNTFGTTAQATGTQGRLGYAFSLHRFTSQGASGEFSIPEASDSGVTIVPVGSASSASSALAKLRYGFGAGAYAELTFRDQSSLRDQSAALSTQNDDGTFDAFPGSWVAAHNSAYGLDLYSPVGPHSADGSRHASLLLRHFQSVADQSVTGPLADNGSAYFFNDRDALSDDTLEYNRAYAHGTLTFKAGVRIESLTEPFGALAAGGAVDTSRPLAATSPSEDTAGMPAPSTASAVERTVALRYTFDALRNVQASIATYYSDFSTFGTALDPKLGFVWTPNRTSVLRASYGTSFQSPKLTELFVPQPLPTPPPGGTVAIGNPNLKAEHATEYQLGYEHEFGPAGSGTRAELDLYRTNMHNAIQQFVSPTGYTYPVNISGLVYQGFDLRLDRRLGARMHVSAGYSELSAYPTSVPPNIGGGSIVAGQQFMGVPLHRASLAFEADNGHNLTYDFGVVYEGRNNELNRPPFATLRAAINTREGPYTLTLSGTNLTDAYSERFTGTDNGIPYPGPDGPIATPAFALPAPQITLLLTRRY